MKLSIEATIILVRLRECSESAFTRRDGAQWAQVYLDNARPEGMSARSFAGYLSALERAGMYKSQGDDCFGDVKLTP